MRKNSNLNNNTGALRLVRNGTPVIPKNIETSSKIALKKIENGVSHVPKRRNSYHFNTMEEKDKQVQEMVEKKEKEMNKYFERRSSMGKLNSLPETGDDRYIRELIFAPKKGNDTTLEKYFDNLIAMIEDAAEGLEI